MTKKINKNNIRKTIKNTIKNTKRNTKTKKNKTIKKKGGNKNGPYYSIDNIYIPSYSRYGSPGTSKLWKGGIYLN